jgi:hypothetical protein
MISSSSSFSYSTEQPYYSTRQSKKSKVSNERNAGVAFSTLNNTIDSSTAVVSRTSNSRRTNIMKTVNEVYPKIQRANHARTFAELLVAKNVKISSYDEWSRKIRLKYPDCLVDMKRTSTAAATEYGDLYIITYMPSTVHDVCVIYFHRLIDNYCSQDDDYEEALITTFPSEVCLGPDAGMAVRLPAYRNDHESVLRTVLIEVEKSHRSLSGLHTHIINKMNQFNVKFGVGIKINQRRYDGNFAVVCLLFNRDTNGLAICFRAIDFGTADVETTQRNEIVGNIGTTLEVLDPRVFVNPQNTSRLSRDTSPWGDHGTFTITGQEIFGGLTHGEIIDGESIHLPQSPTNLVVDLFILLKKICFTLKL